MRIVIGFMGGRVRAENRLHREALVAQDLRAQDTGNLHVLMFANHDHRALQAVLALLDQNGDHTLSAAECAAADIAIFGHSWGASETITLARALQARGVPVALTIQVDSVQKPGENDHDIPANVAEAVNLYQRQGLLRGRAFITPEDPAKTRILLNEQFHYGDDNHVDITRFPWFARTFMREHIMIESDPELWARVESLLEQAVQIRKER